MYSLDINFLSDRVERQPEPGAAAARVAQDSVRPLYYGVAVGVFLPALVLGLWFFLQNRNAQLEQQQTQLANELTALEADLQQVGTINAQITQIQADNKALATVFDRIKPWSAILQDVRDRVPARVQISSIEQLPPDPAAAVPTPLPPVEGQPAPVAPAAPEPAQPRIAVSGRAQSFNDVNDFLLTLQRSQFLDGASAKLVSAELIDNPIRVESANTSSPANIQVQLPKVVKYRIESSLTNLPASQLVQDLERTLSVGLAARIQALRDKGVLQP